MVTNLALPQVDMHVRGSGQLQTLRGFELHWKRVGSRRRRYWRLFQLGRN